MSMGTGSNAGRAIVLGITLAVALGGRAILAADTVPGEAEILWRQIAVQDTGSYDGPCPQIAGWKERRLFESSPVLSASPVLREICVYTDVPGAVTESKLSALRTNPYLKEVQADRMVLASASGEGSETLAAALLETLRTRFIEENGGVADLPGGPSVRLALLDTAPTMRENPRCLLTEPCSCRKCPSSLPDLSPHGPSLGAFAHTLLCDDTGACGVQVTSRLVLPYRYTEFDPMSTLAAGEHGYVGTLSDLAGAIWDELQEVKGGASARNLILNLSLAWHPRFGGYEDDVIDMPLDVRAVYLVIQEAVREGALVIAAAGNRPDDYGEADDGPLLPAAWESRPAPSPGTGSVYEPLVYAAAGVDRHGASLSNAQPASLPPLVAYGDHAAVEGSATLTGSSVAALVVSAAAAAAWQARPELSAAEVMDRLYRTGETVLGVHVDFCLGTPPGRLGACLDPERVEARQVSLCRAYHGCEDGPCLPCLAVPSYPTVDLSSVTFNLPGVRKTRKKTPAKQHPGVTTQLWLYPQPGSNPCPACGVGLGAGKFYGQIENYDVTELSDLTLTCAGKSYELRFGAPPGDGTPAAGAFQVALPDGFDPLCGDLELSARLGKDLSVSAPVYRIEDEVVGDGLR